MQETKISPTEDLQSIEIPLVMRNRNAHRSSLYLNPGGDKREREMKPSLTRISVGLFLLVTLAATIPAARANSCTTPTAAGDYGFTLTGVILTSSGGIPAAAVGRATVDVSGHVTGSEARSVAGGYADETLTGSLR